MAASTSSGLPPITAVIEVGVTALAAAIARPRSRTNTMASLVGQGAHEGRRGDLADGVTGDHADAVRPVRPRRGAARAASRPAATSSGWATAVSRMVSASASVP